MNGWENLIWYALGFITPMVLVMMSDTVHLMLVSRNLEGDFEDEEDDFLNENAIWNDPYEDEDEWNFDGYDIDWTEVKS